MASAHHSTNTSPRGELPQLRRQTGALAGGSLSSGPVGAAWSSLLLLPGGLEAARPHPWAFLRRPWTRVGSRVGSLPQQGSLHCGASGWGATWGAGTQGHCCSVSEV